MENYNIVFESENIIYIKVNEDLVDDYLNMVNDVNVQKYISHNRKIYTKEDEINWIKEKLKENSLVFSMIEKSSNDFIGNIEIMEIKDNIGELGIAITSKKQNKHYGQESIKAIIDYAINKLNLNGLELNVYSFNPRGVHCYKKVGFIVDGDGKSEEEIHMIYNK